MVDFDRLEEKALEGFGSGAVAFAILTAVSNLTAGSGYLEGVGAVLFVALSILGIVSGLGKTQKQA